MQLTHINIKLTIVLIIILSISCKQKSKLFSELSKSQNATKVMVIVYNKDNYCLGCDIGLQGLLINANTNIEYKNNIVTVLKEVRDIDKKSIEENLITLGVDNRFVYNNELFKNLTNMFTSVPSSGGIIIIDNKDNIIFESSFKDPNFSKKALNL